MLFFSQEKFLLTKIPLDDRGYIDLIVLKFWLLSVPDKLLGFLLSSSPSPSQASRFSSSHTSSFSVFFSQAHNGSDGDGDGDGSGNRRGTHFLEKKIIFFITHWVFCLFFWFCTVLCWFFVWLNMKWIENLIGFWVFEDERLKNRRSRLTRETIG